MFLVLTRHPNEAGSQAGDPIIVNVALILHIRGVRSGATRISYGNDDYIEVTEPIAHIWATLDTMFNIRRAGPQA